MKTYASKTNLVLSVVVTAWLLGQGEPLAAGVDTAAPQIGKPVEVRTFSDIWTNIREAYAIPIAFEYPGDDELLKPTTKDRVVFKIEQGELLKTVLDRFVQLTAGRYRWAQSHTTISLIPIVTTGKRCIMDEVVSLNVNGVSVWDAFLALARVVNGKLKSEGETTLRMEISPHFLSNGVKPPDTFTETKCITLNLKEVTVRDVICAIIEASLLDMSYVYVPPDRRSPRCHVTVWLYKDGRVYWSHDRMRNAEVVAFEKDIQASCE